MRLPWIVVRRGQRGIRPKRLQKRANGILRARKFPWREVKPDGVAGGDTFGAIHMAGWLLGLSDRQLKKIRNGKVTRHAYLILTGKRQRSDAMKRRDAARRDEARHLRRKHAILEKRRKEESQDGLIEIDGRQVAAWIGRWVLKARAAGLWHGTVSSGYRDPQYSRELCENMCGAPSCPGRCAGESSNHSGKVFPAGAVDVTDYWQFGEAMRKLGAPLKNSLASTDPVHFSYTGY